MAKKKGYNLKARNPGNVKIDNSTAKNIVIEIDQKGNFDDCNVLALPSKKRKTSKNKEKSLTSGKLLTKKQRKKFEKIIEKKEKKGKRAELFEELSKCVAPEEELKQYISISQLQTKGLKRHFQEINKPEYQPPPVEKEAEDGITINAIKVSKKQRLALLQEEEPKTKRVKDPSVIDFKDSSSSESESEGENEQENKSENKPKDESENKQENEPKDKSEKKPENEAKKETKENKSKNEVTIISDITESKNSKKQQKPLEKKPTTFVMLDRKPEIQKARLKLPILGEEQLLVEAINENPVIIITGETGSGKTTQVPQFLYEAGYAKEKMIGVTEPRRVAAISMSERVAEEMNLTKKEVSYLIRFEGNATDDTKIKFMTDGVLLKEVQSDFLLKKYAVIILDEAHERSVYTDVLIGLLTRIVKLREKRNDPLKLIIMSATLRVQDFADNEKLFPVKPPVINIQSRQFPVTIHFNRKTNDDYVKEALRKAVKVHTQLPDGGILIFLTGQREVSYVVRKLRNIFPFTDKKKLKNKKKLKEITVEETEEDVESEFLNPKKKQKKKAKPTVQSTPSLPEINLDTYSAVPNEEVREDLAESNFWDAENSDEEMWEAENEEDVICDLSSFENVTPLWVLPLYSLMPTHKQAMVFQPPPEGSRLCVVATNVAETSLTIPNIKYVIDSGRSKMRLYDKVTGVSTYKVTYASKAAANQRAGRAGRTAPGHCYRLYSSAVFNDSFEEFSEPEIRRKPVDDLILQMKVMNIHKVVNFPFPTPPGIEQLQSVERRLCLLGALEKPRKITGAKFDLYAAKITNLGRIIAQFPVAPRFGKMLMLSQQQNLMRHTIRIVSALSIQEVLIEVTPEDGEKKQKWMQMRRFWAGTGNSLLLGDPMVLIRAVAAAEFAATKGKLTKFCEDYGLREKAVKEIRKIQQQLTNEIKQIVNLPDLCIDPDLPPPTELEAKLLRQIILSGNIDHVAMRVTPESTDDRKKSKFTYRTSYMEETVYIHSSSVLRKNWPEFVVYQEIYEVEGKHFMRNITAIEPEWLPKFAPSLCRLSEPLPDPAPRYDENTGKVLCHVKGSFGRCGWELPVTEVEHPKSIDGVKLFAAAFMEGKVCPKPKLFLKSNLIADPSSIRKSWSNNIPRVTSLLGELMSKGVMTRDQLLEAWSCDPKFLLDAFKKWVKEEKHVEVASMWPPVM